MDILNYKRILTLLGLFSLFTLQAQDSWKPNKALVEKLEQRGNANYDESKVPQYELPPLLISKDDIPINTTEQWNSIRRQEVLSILKDQLFGHVIGKPDSVTFRIYALNPDTLDHASRKKTILATIHKNQKAYQFKIWLFTPINAAGPYPAFLLINHRGKPANFPDEIIQSGFWPVKQILQRGYATACFQALDLDPDSNEDRGWENGIHGFLEPEGERPDYAWGTLASWAWGASIVMDYLETDRDIISNEVAVVGHSRGGKTALWAGAMDNRFSLVISNNSGCGGAALSRRNIGETVARINTVFPNWFCKNFHQYNNRADLMPFDQHFLLALTAPRGLYVTSSGDDLWADPKGEFLSLKEAEKVYSLYGLKTIPGSKMPPLNTPVMGERTGYHIKEGEHNMTPYDWQRFMDFADRLFR